MASFFSGLRMDTLHVLSFDVGLMSRAVREAIGFAIMRMWKNYLKPRTSLSLHKLLMKDPFSLVNVTVHEVTTEDFYTYHCRFFLLCSTLLSMLSLG